jgi:phosphatidylglycerophosphatase A
MAGKTTKNGREANLKLYSEAQSGVKISLMIATCLYAGFLPLAPGTWGSAFAFALFYLFPIPVSGWFVLIICFALFVAGIIASETLQRYDGIYDNPKVVIDEFLGFIIAVAFLPKNLIVFILAFVIFRILDIWKPAPISYVEKNVKGGLGVMLDDIIAGVFTNIILRIITALFIL